VGRGGLGGVAIGVRVHYAKRFILTMYVTFFDNMTKIYIYGFANLMLSLWCYSLKNKSNLP